MTSLFSRSYSSETALSSAMSIRLFEASVHMAAQLCTIESMRQHPSFSSLSAHRPASSHADTSCRPKPCRRQYRRRRQAHGSGLSLVYITSQADRQSALPCGRKTSLTKRFHRQYYSCRRSSRRCRIKAVHAFRHHGLRSSRPPPLHGRERLSRRKISAAFHIGRIRCLQADLS